MAPDLPYLLGQVPGAGRGAQTSSRCTRYNDDSAGAAGDWRACRRDGFYGDFVGKDKDKFWNGALYFKAAEHHEGASEADHLNAGELASSVREDAHGEEAAKKTMWPQMSMKLSIAHGEEGGHAAEGEHGGEGGHHVPTWVLWAPFFAMLTGTLAQAGIIFAAIRLRPGLLRPGGMIYGFLKNKWYFDEIYDFLLVKPALAFGRFLWKDGDGKTIDGLGPDGISTIVAAGARRIVKLQSGYLYHYAFAMLVGIAVFVTFILIRTGGGQ